MGLPKNNHSRHIRLLIVAWQRQFLFHILRMHQTDRSIRGRNGWHVVMWHFNWQPDMSAAVFNFKILQCQISCRKISGLQHFCWGWQQSISENCQQIPNSFLSKLQIYFNISWPLGYKILDILHGERYTKMCSSF